MGLNHRLARMRHVIRRAAFAPRSRLDAIQVQLGALHSRWVEQLDPTELGRAEFRVFSQFGEDGIIQFLVQRVPIEERTFVEIGVEDYSESNTRFLLVHDAWRGLIIDAGTAHRRFLEAADIAWRHTIDAVTGFVTRENVDALIRDAGLSGDVGLLSLDIDGNDVWVLEAIESVSPRILVVEYNSVFGPERAVSVPYDPNFTRFGKHFSGLYWGGSLAAVAAVAGRKGYALVGANRAGNNAFFVRRDVVGDIPKRSAGECWRKAQYRDSRAPSGELTYLTDDVSKLRTIRELPLVDLESGEELSVGELYGV